jgi:RNA polymerase sigma-70 factor (ECF subfamily)
MLIATLESSGDRFAEAPELTAEFLIATYLPRVHRFAVMVSPRGAEAEDLAQQALLQALEGIKSFDSHRGTLDAWLWRIVVNVGRDAGRAARCRELLVERLALSRPWAAAATPEAAAIDLLRDGELIAAVRDLPRRYRSLIALRYGAGLSSEEAADALGTSRMAVAKATRRALDRLRERLLSLEVEL